MAETQEQTLKRYIWIIEDWHGNRLPDEIISVFFNLEELDQSKNKELWQQLKQAIKNNKEFEFEGFQLDMQSLTERANQGYWWWKTIADHRK